MNRSAIAEIFNNVFAPGNASSPPLPRNHRKVVPQSLHAAHRQWRTS